MNGSSPLVVAAQNNSMRCVDFLLSHFDQLKEKADQEGTQEEGEEDERGETNRPSKPSPASVEEYCNLPNNDGNVALHFAVHYNYQDIFHLLLQFRPPSLYYY